MNPRKKCEECGKIGSAGVSVHPQFFGSNDLQWLCEICKIEVWERKRKGSPKGASSGSAKG